MRDAPAVGDTEREQLRRLAVWLACRRDADEAVGHLTRYGPAACERVATHLTALKLLLAREADAFAAVEAGAGVRPQRPLPAVEALRATVHSLQRARERKEP